MAPKTNMIVIMSEEFIEHLIAKAERRRTLGRGRYLFHQGDPVREVFIVARGLIELSRRHRDGGTIVLQRAGAKTVLAEASLYAGAYHCDGRAAAPSSLWALPKSAFRKLLREDADFSASWAAHLAGAVQAARTRCEILARKTVAERLDGWLAWRGCGLPAKGRWKGIALDIAVSPEALYRELAKRRSGR